VLDLQANWSPEAARMAAQLGSRHRDMQFPTPERTLAFARAVWSETVRLTGRAILETALGFDLGSDRLAQAVCSGEGAIGLARISLMPSIPVVAVGGPVKVYYPEVGQRLGCEMVFPEHCDVANAVGAATGVVAQTVTVRVDGDGTGIFLVHSTVGTTRFSEALAALEAAQTLAHQAAFDAAVGMGAQDPQVKVSLRKQLMPNATSDTGLLEAVITAEAIGRPHLGH
jgi:hypothetical protein